MRKLFSLLLILSTLLAALPASGEEAEVFALEGTIVEITDDALLLNTQAYGEVQAATDEDTVWDTDVDLAPGDYVYVDYNGQMTRSVPAQVHAARVCSYRLLGDVVEIDAEAKTLLLRLQNEVEYRVNLPETLDMESFDAPRALVYFNGVATMSLPAQISAGLVVPGYTAQGEITELGEDSLMLGEGQEALQVNFAAGTLPEGLAVGDIIRVTYDGVATRSLPAQISAMEIVEITR